MNEDLRNAIYWDISDDTYLTMKYYFDKYQDTMPREVLVDTFIEAFIALVNNIA